MSKLETIIKKAICSFAIGISLFGAGCFSPHQHTFSVNSYNIEDITGSRPRKRLGAYPTPTIGMTFRGINDLGHHGYRPNLSEKNGIVYTKQAGHIDIFHTRLASDWTAYLASETFKYIQKNKNEFIFKSTELSIYHVNLYYPENWKSISEDKKEKISYEISIGLGKYFTHTACVWHEILTWFGYKSTGIFSEFLSAFSWEDPLSDVLGINIAEKSFYFLKNSTQTYDEAVTSILNQELEKLEIQKSYIARDISERLRGKWFSGNLPTVVNIKKRNFDVGLDDGYITPFIPQFPGEKPVKPEPLKDYPVPTLDFLSEYGFSLELKIEPKEWEKGKILKIAGQDKYIFPERDFPKIIGHIREDAKKMFGENVDKPTLD